MKTISITPVYDSGHSQAPSISNESAFNRNKIPIETPSTCASSALVALQVLDASMAPELNAGNVVIIDRTGKLNEGSLVLVETHDHLLIRRWHALDNNDVELIPLNPMWKTLRCAKDEVQLKGIVIQRTGRRRRDTKRYS